MNSSRSDIQRFSSGVASGQITPPTMSADELIQHYGNFAIAVGTFCEGETVMLAAGALAGAGLLTLPLAIAYSMAGIFARDTLCFFAGRLAGNRLIRWFPR